MPLIELYYHYMSIITVDKLAYCEALKAAGFTDQQAKTQAQTLDNELRDTVATRHDLELMKRDIMITLESMIMALGGILIAIKYLQ